MPSYAKSLAGLRVFAAEQQAAAGHGIVSTFLGVAVDFTDIHSVLIEGKVVKVNYHKARSHYINCADYTHAAVVRQSIFDNYNLYCKYKSIPAKIEEESKMKYKVGDRVVVLTDKANSAEVLVGDEGVVVGVFTTTYHVTMDKFRAQPGSGGQYWVFRNEDIKLKEKQVMKDLLTDAKSFIKENRTIIYAVTIIILLDHFMLDGKLRGKIESLLSGALDTIKGKLDAK